MNAWSQQALFDMPAQRTVDVHPPAVGSGDPVTSRAAAGLHVTNEVARRLALEALLAAGRPGLTDFDLEDRTGIKQTSIGKRRLELVRAGKVRPKFTVVDGRRVQATRPAPSGCPSCVWVAVSA